ncbi:hypothetical protein ACVR1G_01375 [Streptococcus dentasini]
MSRFDPYGVYVANAEQSHLRPLAVSKIKLVVLFPSIVSQARLLEEPPPLF